MADTKISALTSYSNPDAANDVIPIVDTANTTTKKITRNAYLGLTSAPVGLTDTQVLTNKTLTAPTLTSPILSGTITGIYTLAGTPTFPSSVVTLTGSQTLTNKILTSPTISSPTITNASISADAITGFSSANSGTIYGMSVTSSVITSASVGTNSIVTGSQFVQKTQNPYKFSVYRSAALTSSNSAIAVLFDTKTFDTGTNVDVVTNKGRFTAPVAGFYHFDGLVGNTAAGATPILAYLYKNGSVIKQGNGAASSASNGTYASVSGTLQLAATDYVEVYFIGGNGSTIGVGADKCYFDGFLISAT